MSKKMVGEKNATFSVGSEGFSIHTFEISRSLTEWEYRKIKGFLYDEIKSTYKEVALSDYKCHVCTGYHKQGIHKIRMIHLGGESFCDRYRMEMIVNPRKLLDPKASYLGIFEPSEENVKKLTKNFRKLFKGTLIPDELDAYKVSRIDLCVNIHCDTGKIFHELVRVLRKLPTPRKYQRVYKKHGGKKENSLYNRHYIKFHCGTHGLVIYDKTYQMGKNNLNVSYEKLPKGVLRIEMCCLRPYLKKIEKKQELEKGGEVLWYMTQNSEQLLIKTVCACFPHWKYYQKSELEERIKNSRCPEDQKAWMLRLVEQMRRKQTFESAFQSMGLTDKEGRTLLERFERLGISPVPLREKFCANVLLDLGELLQQIASAKEAKVLYAAIKYR